MKAYPHIITKLFYEPLLITPLAHEALCQLLESRMGAMQIGGMPMPDEPETPEDMPDEEDMAERGKVAIIPVHGTIVRYPEDIAMSKCGCSLEGLNAMIDAAEADPNISTIIYDFRTPGGSATGVPETGRKIASSRKDTIAFTASECCSAGIWLAAQCKKFYATGSSQVGSVGVVMKGLDMTAAMKKDGIKVNEISAGKYKTLGAPWKVLTGEERAILQAGVDKLYAQFKEAMETYRIVDDEHFGNGRVFDGEDAAQLGFTDGVVEGIEDILDGMVE